MIVNICLYCGKIKGATFSQNSEGETWESHGYCIACFVEKYGPDEDEKPEEEGFFGYAPARRAKSG